MQTDPAFNAGNPKKLLDMAYFGLVGLPLRTYDVSNDGERFLMIKDAAANQTMTAPTMVVVVNWVEELKARVPVVK